MNRLAIRLDDYMITENFEILPYRTNYPDTSIKKDIEKVRNDIIRIKMKNNVSFFLALKELLKDIKSKFNRVEILILVNNIEAVNVDINTIKDLNTFFVYSIYGCSGSECLATTMDFGIIFDGIKIEIVNGKIHIKNS